MNDILLIYGGHSTGIEILDLIRDHFPSRFSNCISVVEEGYEGALENTINEKDLPDFISKSKGQVSYIISMSNQRLRYKFFNYSVENSLKPITLIHPGATIAGSALIGGGVYIAANASVSSNAHIHNHVVINYNTIIGHDSIIHDNVIVNPGAVIGGNVEIMERVLVGANSFIMQGRRIGSDCSIDALTYVDQDLDSRAIATGTKMKTFP